jgi:hypothetical protein
MKPQANQANQANQALSNGAREDDHLNLTMTPIVGPVTAMPRTTTR